MKKIVTLTGSKNTPKIYIASKLSENSDVAYIKPYTDKEDLSSAELEMEYHQVSVEEMDILLQSDDLLSCTRINGNRWAYFKSQLTHAYNVLIVDDYGLCDLRDVYDNIYSIKVVSKNMKPSDRVGVYLYNHEFDEVFDYDTGDLYELEARMV